MSKSIPLSQGYVAIVDDADYDSLAVHKWCAQPNDQRVYAIRNIYFGSRTTGDRRHITVRMHRVIMGCADTSYPHIDHWDGDGLNNQRANLRFTTQSGNLANSRMRRDNTSGYKGVFWHKRSAIWCASIGVNGKHIWLGQFFDPHDAAVAYDVAARQHYGEFARTNFAWPT